MAGGDGVTITLDPGGDGFFTNGVTPVELVGAQPAGTTQSIFTGTYYNADDIAHGWLLEFVVGTDRFVIAAGVAGSLEPGSVAVWASDDRKIVIDGATTSLEFSLLEATSSAEGHLAFFGYGRVVT